VAQSAGGFTGVMENLKKTTRNSSKSSVTPYGVPPPFAKEEFSDKTSQNKYLTFV